MKVCLLTGAGGFVGRHLVPQLAERGWQAVGAGRTAKPPSWLAAADYVSFDIRDATAVEQALRDVRPDGLINLASLPSGEPADLCRTHVNGVCNLLYAVRSHAPECRVVLTGSAAEYGRISASDLPITESTPCQPLGPYGISKLAASELALELARAWRLRVAIARPFNIIGPGVPPHLLVGALIERVQEALEANEARVVRVGNVDSVRDFVAVEDVVAGMLSLLGAPHESGIFNLCSGRPVQVRDVVLKLLSFSPTPLEWTVDPALLRPDDVPVSFGSYARAEAAFGYRPNVPLERSLRDAWNERQGH